jgi:Raf kinase inhibitor-like YbhB/YbcL family protein
MHLILRSTAVTALFALTQIGATHAASMSVSSSSFTDGHAIPVKFAGTGVACGGGQGVSPQISWTNLPTGTRSVAVVLFDPDGGKGLGVAHWITYNIDPARGQIKQGEAATTIPGITVGKNMTGASEYRGLCPPAGDTPHHYIATVIATDLEPGSLPQSLDREGLLSALSAHSLAGQSIGGLYGH